ncbi:hypothetical protein HDU78_000003 [Chytriomyces hyalinus]|nr:hypothetical protein HDU78_000003 [Chytriomyces hyalinus]
MCEDVAFAADSAQPAAMYFFKPQDVPGLKAYTYKSVDKSLIANRILNPFWWSVIIEFVPSWVAPNLITLTGFLCVLANVGISFYYSPDLLSPCPAWCYVSFAIGLFMYQSLDAIDGKQARKTGSSGPLGELFDHGCDALNTGFATFLGVTALGMGQTWLQVLAVLCCLANFFLSTWEEYYTGVLYLSECSGPVEGVLSICLVLIATAVYGTEIWSFQLGQVLPEAIVNVIPWTSVVELPLNAAFVYFGVLIVVGNVVGSVMNVQSAIKSNPATAQKAKKDWPIFTLLPFPILAGLLLLYPMLHPSVALKSGSIVAYIILVTFLTGYQVSSMIVAHISKRRFPLASMIIVPSTIACLGLLAAEVLNGGVMTHEIMWGTTLVAGLWYISWFVRVVADLCAVFDIYCLRIKDKKKAK